MGSNYENTRKQKFPNLQYTKNLNLRYIVTTHHYMCASLYKCNSVHVNNVYIELGIVLLSFLIGTIVSKHNMVEQMKMSGICKINAASCS